MQVITMMRSARGVVLIGVVIMIMLPNVQGAHNSSNYLSSLANVSGCNCYTTALDEGATPPSKAGDLGGVGGGGGGGGGAGGGGSAGGDCHSWWTSWGWGAGWGWGDGHNGGGGGGGGGGGAIGSFNHDELKKKKKKKKSRGLYLLGEYGRCMKHGKCRGMKLICPLHCHGPCFYDCEDNCKAHCIHH